MLVMLVVELFADQAVVEGRLQLQLVIIQFQLVGHILVRVETLLDVDVIATKMSDCVREFLHSRLSHRLHEVIEGNGEKVT